MESVAEVDVNQDEILRISAEKWCRGLAASGMGRLRQVECTPERCAAGAKALQPGEFMVDLAGLVLHVNIGVAEGEDPALGYRIEPVFSQQQLREAWRARLSIENAIVDVNLGRHMVGLVMKPPSIDEIQQDLIDTVREHERHNDRSSTQRLQALVGSAAGDMQPYCREFTLGALRHLRTWWDAATQRDSQPATPPVVTEATVGTVN